MEKMEKLVEIRNQNGKVNWSVWINRDQAHKLLSFDLDSQDNLQNENEIETERSTQSNTDPMTQAQKRYLFRLLAERGIEKDEAYQKLKEAFGVESLQDVGKLEASREIERLLAQGGDKR